MKLLKITAILIIIITLLSTACYATSLNLPTINDYDEYKEYIKEHKNSLPEDFVHYRSLSALGEFTQFSNIGLIKGLPKDVFFIETGGTSRPIADYQYTITDKNGYKVVVKAYHDDDVSLDDVVYKPKHDRLSMDSVTDLRHHPSGEDGLLEINDCYYQYLDGELCLIAWRSREVIFTLTFNMSDFDSSHDDEKTTLVTRLLDPDTAKSATGKLKWIAYPHWLLPLIIALAAVIIVSAVIITILLLRKKKKNKSVDDAPSAIQIDISTRKKGHKRLYIILYSALIIVVVILIGIWIWYGRSLGVHTGMEPNDYYDKISQEDRFDYLRFSFYENQFGGPVVVRFNAEHTAIDNVKIFSRLGVDASTESFKKIKKGMDLYDVIAKVGIPRGSATFGLLSTVFATNEGTEYIIYWIESENHDTLIVSDIVAAGDAHSASSSSSSPTPVSYVSYEMEAFFSDWLNAQTYGHSTYSDPTHKFLAPDCAFPLTSRLTIPTLPPEDYAFWAVEADASKYYFRYVPIEDAGIKDFNDTDGITITVTKADVSFDQAATQNDWEISDGMVYLPESNEWFTHQDGKLISIQLPQTFVLEDADAVNQLLRYTTYVVHNDPY